MTQAMSSSGIGRRAPEFNQEVHYEHYRRLDEAIRRGNEFDLPGYVHLGSRAHVLVMAQRGIVVKISRRTNRDAQRKAIEERIDVLERSSRLKDVEQLVAYSLSEPHVVTGYVDGALFCDVPAAERENIPDEHFVRLIDTVAVMVDRGLTYDSSPANFIINNHAINFIDAAIAEVPGDLVDEVSAFGGRTLLEGVDATTDIPEYARRFYAVCGRMLGSSALRLVENRSTQYRLNQMVRRHLNAR